MNCELASFTATPVWANASRFHLNSRLSARNLGYGNWGDRRKLMTMTRADIGSQTPKTWRE